MSDFIKLSEIADTTVGFVGTMAKHYKEEGVPFLRSLNVDRFSINETDIKYISEEFNAKLKKSMLRKNDILIVRTGNPGTCCVVPNEYIGANCSDVVIVRPNTRLVNPYYLAGYINVWGQKQINNNKVGAVQKHFNVHSADEMLINLPSLEVQNKIANVLTGINMKISTNRQINDNLLHMAYETYMHTFFSKTCNSTLGDILIEHGKSSIKVGEAKESDGDFPFFTSGDAILRWPVALVDGRNCYLNTGGNADVKFYIGKSAYSTDTWCVTAKNDLSDYLYVLLESIKPELDQKFFQGTGLKHLQKPLLKDRPIYIPTDDELSDFNSRVQPWLTMISDNIRESEELTTLRDWLLPMLMNGQAIISD